MLFFMIWRNMDTREIRHLVALSKHLNFTAAADELGISQSALSKSIQAIEDRLQLRLFDRNRGGVRITAVGRDLSRKAAGVLTQIRDLDWFARDAAGGSAGRISFGMTPVPAKALLSTLLLKMNSEHPQLSCRVAVRTADALLEALVNEEIEFYVAGEHLFSTEEAIDRKLLGLFPAAILVRPDHPVLKFQPESFPDCLAAFPLLFTGPFPTALGHPNAEFVSHHGVHYAVEGLGTLVKLTEGSDAILLASLFGVHEELRQGRLKAIPFGMPLQPIRIMIHTLAHRTLSPAARRIIKEARQEVEKLGRADKRLQP
jgi:DNA-binding transcriptional LysR family regulator